MLAEQALKTSFQFRTVCEVTREIYDIICANKDVIGNDVFEQIHERLKEQIVMQKKMDARLKHYKSDWLFDEKLVIVCDFEKRAKARQGRS